MFFKIKTFAIILLLSLSGWFGWKGYLYFFDTKTPILTFSGLQNNNFYSGDIQCSLAVNKPGQMSVLLDEKTLINNFKLSSSQESPFTIPTQTIANGKHELTINFTDNTFHKNKASKNYQFFVDNTPLKAAFVQKQNNLKVLQGRTLHLQFQVNKKIKTAKIKTLSKTYDAFPEMENSCIYEAFIPTDCEENPNEYLISIELQDKVGNSLSLENKFQIIASPFKKEILNIKQSKILAEREQGKDPSIFEEKMESLTKNSPHQKMWRGKFCAPINITRTSCEFGSTRITQHKGKYIHKAVDILSLPKSVVWAPQSGVIVLKDRFEHSGNTVVIDHGYGILSMYFHLDDFANINVGKKISQGNPIGYLGKTGHATGYHLHWELRINNTAVDPMQWIKSNF